MDNKGLMIGNYLKKVPVGKISAICANDLVNGNLIWMEPVPITPEILLKCVFELFPWGYVKKEGDFGVRLNIHDFSYPVSGNSPVKLKYLHELQNLYFALTKTELTVNL